MAATDLPSVFLDADVLVAGSFSATGASHLTLRLAELGLIDAVSSAQARREAERNLTTKLPAGLAAFRALVDAAVRFVPDPDTETLAGLRDRAEQKDVPILGAALAAGCGWLLTFHVTDFRPDPDEIRIARPGEFVDRLRSLLEGLAE